MAKCNLLTILPFKGLREGSAKCLNEFVKLSQRLIYRTFGRVCDAQHSSAYFQYLHSCWMSIEVKMQKIRHQWNIRHLTIIGQRKNVTASSLRGSILGDFLQNPI